MTDEIIKTTPSALFEVCFKRIKNDPQFSEYVEKSSIKSRKSFLSPDLLFTLSCGR